MQVDEDVGFLTGCRARCRRGSATLRYTQTFLQYHLDTTPQPCYSLTIKSVEEEKYRSISAQRAWRLV